MREEELSRRRLLILEEVGIKLIVVMAIVTSIVYAFWVEKRNTQTFEVLYTWYTQDYTSVSFMGFSYTVTKYLKKLLLIWLLGWFGITIPLSWILLFSAAFSYGFTTTALLLLLGGKGIVVGMFSYGLQAIILLGIGSEILRKSIDLGVKYKENVKKYYIQLLIPLVCGSIVITLLDLIGRNIVQLLFL